MADAFKDFVARQRKTVAPAVDWDKQRDDWIAYLRELYAGIKAYLHDYIEAGEITLHETSIELNEENIGVYRAPRLAIFIGAQEITLTPIGTLLIGSKGRVDVEGSHGTSRLVLINANVTDARQMFKVTVTTMPPGGGLPSPAAPAAPEEIKWAWKIVGRPPLVIFTELNEDTFFEMLMEVSGG